MRYLLTMKKLYLHLRRQEKKILSCTAAGMNSVMKIIVMQTNHLFKGVYAKKGKTYADRTAADTEGNAITKNY